MRGGGGTLQIQNAVQHPSLHVYMWQHITIIYMVMAITFEYSSVLADTYKNKFFSLIRLEKFYVCMFLS